MKIAVATASRTAPATMKRHRPSWRVFSHWSSFRRNRRGLSGYMAKYTSHPEIEQRGSRVWLTAPGGASPAILGHFLAMPSAAARYRSPAAAAGEMLNSKKPKCRRGQVVTAGSAFRQLNHETLLQLLRCRF